MKLQDAFATVMYTDVHDALSWDQLHFNGGLYRDYLWAELQKIIFRFLLDCHWHSFLDGDPCFTHNFDRGLLSAWLPPTLLYLPFSRTQCVCSTWSSYNWDHQYQPACNTSFLGLSTCMSSRVPSDDHSLIELIIAIHRQECRWER